MQERNIVVSMQRSVYYVFVRLIICHLQQCGRKLDFWQSPEDLHFHIYRIWVSGYQYLLEMIFLLVSFLYYGSLPPEFYLCSSRILNLHIRLNTSMQSKKTANRWCFLANSKLIECIR